VRPSKAKRKGAAPQKRHGSDAKDNAAGTQKRPTATKLRSRRASQPATHTGQRKRTVGKRRPRRPLIEIGRAKREKDVLAGLDRWKKRHRKAAAFLADSDVLVDAMRGRYSTWTRIRVNLEHVPQTLRPAQEPLDPNENTSASS
jgi:hypothetical protein